MDNKPIAKFTITEHEYMDNFLSVNISIDYTFEEGLIVTSNYFTLKKFLNYYRATWNYTTLNDIIDILRNGGYKLKFSVPNKIPVYMLHKYQIKIITFTEESMKNYKDHTTNLTYNLLVKVDQKATLNSMYGVSNMYPASPTDDGIRYCHHDTRLLDSITKTAHTTPKKVICSGPVTTVIFEDGTKSQVSCSEDDSPYNDYEKAFMMAWLYQLVGKKNVRKVLKENQDIFDDSEDTNSIVNALNNIRFMFNGRKG